MYAKIAIFVGCLHINWILGVDGQIYRFQTPDQLPPAPASLQYAFVIFRHGIRSPINNIYGSEAEFLKMWPDGKGGLTEDGKRLMVHVGQSLRTRYGKLVPDYDRDTVEVTSTTSPRATMSAYSVAAGMFPPQGEILFEDIPSWQPVPVLHSAGYDKHHLFDEVKGNTKCTRYTKIKDSIIRDEMKKLSMMQKLKLKKINNNLKTSSSPIKSIDNLDKLFNVWDVYFMELLSEKQSEEWTKEYMPTMIQIAQFRLWSRMHGKNDGQYSILQYYTGPMLNQILTEMLLKSTDCLKKRVQNSNPYNMNEPLCRPRLHLHGSHDLTVGALVWALTNNKQKEKFMAYPGDALIIEMHQDENVKVFLYSALKDQKEMFQPLSLKGLCNDYSCRFTDFLNGLKSIGLSITEEDWKKKCDNVNGVDEGAKWRPIP